MSFSTVSIHNAKSISVGSKWLTNPDGSAFHVLSVAIVDERGHEFDITAFSERAVPLTLAPEVLTQSEDAARTVTA